MREYRDWLGPGSDTRRRAAAATEAGFRDRTCGMLKRARRDGAPGRWRARRVVNLVAAVVVSALLLGILGFGYGTVPALGPALDPGRGAWTSASGGQPVSSQRLLVPGLTGAV